MEEKEVVLTSVGQFKEYLKNTADDKTVISVVLELAGEKPKEEGSEVERDNYNLVYEAALKPGISLDDLYYEFNMQHPKDFRGHSMSVSDIVVLHKGDEDKAFYVDTFGFTEVPEFLLEKVKEQQRDMDEAAYKLGDRYISIQRTDEGFDYSIYDETYHLLDGGELEDPDITIGEVLKQITDELKQPIYDVEHDRYTHTELQGNIRQKDEPVAVDFDDLMEKADEKGQEEDLDAVKPVAELSSIQLAQEIDAFARDFDFYDYNDMVDDREANVSQLAESIESGNTGDISDVLQEILADEDGTAEDQRKAKELIDKLAEYKPLAKVEERKEQNYNMIDNVINNLPQDPEDKKEPAPQREMREAEVKKVRKRVSMKALLLLKKAEVAEREKKPPEASAPSRNLVWA